jgi:hypothetical protein
MEKENNIQFENIGQTVENKEIKNPKSKLKKFIIWAITSLVVILGIVVYFKYYFVYSDGTRVGMIYKFSKKGTIFKTYEGEILLPGTTRGNNQGFNSNRFFFSVTDEAVAKQLSDNQGNEVEVHYVNYNNSLPWRGDNYSESEGQYVVDKLVTVKNKKPNGYGL